MTLHATSSTAPSAELLDQLGNLASQHGQASLADRLIDLQRYIASDFSGFSEDLQAIAAGKEMIARSAGHLLNLSGKYLRPTCVFLAASVGPAEAPELRRLALAVELVHSATLLHDDVVDHSDQRRGRPAARQIYGNAASIFAGDWLLVKALREISSSGHRSLSDSMLTIIDEMIMAESIQLENRGRINASLEDYFRVVEGKTAALFRWAMRAGATAGGLSQEHCQGLEDFGLHLGVAFQLVDDLLDIDGDSQVTGKALFSDLADGKMTYPLLYALERKPKLEQHVRALMDEQAQASAAEQKQAADGQQLSADELAALLAGLSETGALDACRQLAESKCHQAITCLETLPQSEGLGHLVTVAKACVYRKK